MGFRDIYEYKAGIADWIAMGLPVIRRDTSPRIEDVARKDAPTCSPQDSVAKVRAKLPKGWTVCVVLDSERIVLGLADLVREPDAVEIISQMMRPAPLTFRPGGTVVETCKLLQERKVFTALVTKSTGEFIGVLRREELCGG